MNYIYYYLLANLLKKDFFYKFKLKLDNGNLKFEA